MNFFYFILNFIKTNVYIIYINSFQEPLLTTVTIIFIIQLIIGYKLNVHTKVNKLINTILLNFLLYFAYSILFLIILHMMTFYLESPNNLYMHEYINELFFFTSRIFDLNLAQGFKNILICLFIYMEINILAQIIFTNSDIYEEKRQIFENFREILKITKKKSKKIADIELDNTNFTGERPIEYDKSQKKDTENDPTYKILNEMGTDYITLPREEKPKEDQNVDKRSWYAKPKTWGYILLSTVVILTTLALIGKYHPPIEK